VELQQRAAHLQLAEPRQLAVHLQPVELQQQAAHLQLAVQPQLVVLLQLAAPQLPVAP
jgi:hypothetical protein